MDRTVQLPMEGVQLRAFSNEEHIAIQSRSYDDIPIRQVVSSGSKISGKRTNALILFMALTQIVQMMAYGAGIIGAIPIGHALGASELEATWIAASYPLTQGAFVLVSGRLGTVFGHKRMLTLGASWWIFWTLATPYAAGIIGVSVMRALAGIGGGIMVPNAVALLTVTIPPGRRRSLALAIFTAMGPVGGAGGATLVGFFMQWTEWRWLFFFLATLGLVFFGAAILAVPSDMPLDPSGDIDWIGSAMALTGMILFNFVWNQAPVSGWGKPYEYALLIVAVVNFAVFPVYEAKWAQSPIIPVSIWREPSFTPLILTAFFIFMSLGIYIWYVTLFLANIRHWDPVLQGCSFLPMALLGTAAPIFVAKAIALVPAQHIVSVGCTATIGMNILLATAPVHQLFWAMIFPAMLLAACSGDLVFGAGQIITSSMVSRKNQGVAASLVGALFTYGLSTGLGFAGTIEIQMNRNSTDPLRGYRGATYLAIGLATAALVINVLFVRMEKNTKEGWEDEDAEVGVDAKV